MNQRIEDIALHCGAWHQVYENKQFMIDGNFDIGKFAELIVTECAKQAMIFNNNIQSLNDKEIRSHAHRVGDYIMDRLGVGK